MTDTIGNNKRIAKNTLLLYLRQLLIILVNLYTVRIVLKVLGTADYGIYNLIAGIVLMFSFLNSAMTSASQRFFSISIGEKNQEKLSQTFKMMLTVYALLCVMIVLVAETVGWWLVEEKLVVPQERMPIVAWIYQFMVLSSIVTLMCAPYMSALVAHEDMNIYAYVSIVEVVLKLVIVFLLQILPYDKLLVYGFLLLCVSVITTMLYRRYCRKYQECRFCFGWNKSVIIEISGFVGWNFWGTFAWIVKNQGTSILFNLFHGPLLNASQGLANQIRNVVQTFSQNFSLATQPQIIKYYAVGEYHSLFNLLCKSCKLTYFLMLIIVVPLIYNIDYLLQLWLGNVPAHVASFAKLLLIESLIESVSLPMASANQATGKIKLYQFLIGMVGMLNIPFAYVLLKIGFSPESVYILSIGLKLISIMIRFVFLRQIPTFRMKQCFVEIFMPVMLVTGAVFILCECMSFEATTLVTICFSVISIFLMSSVCIYLLGLSREEKKYVLKYIKKII